MQSTQADRPVYFPEWGLVLKQAALPPAQRERYRQAIVRYLGHCRMTQTRASVASARQFVAKTPLDRSSGDTLTYKQALNWFFTEARQYRKKWMTDVPPLARADLGRADWEQRLIQRLRTLQYQWRTEQAYRGWAWRFARFLGLKRIEDAVETEVQAFLTKLATEYRVAVSTQKQALNALVFLLRDVLGSAFSVTLSLSKGLCS